MHLNRSSLKISQVRKKEKGECLYKSSQSNSLIYKNIEASVPSAFLGNNFSLSALEPRLQDGAMLLK